jgi:hypothetical protein
LRRGRKLCEEPLLPNRESFLADGCEVGAGAERLLFYRPVDSERAESAVLLYEQ